MVRQRLPSILLLLALTGLVGAEVAPPDGMPDLTGTWFGTIKAKAWDQHPNADEFGKGKMPFRMDITQAGSDITFKLLFEEDGEDREWVAQGQIGNRNAWAITSGDDPIAILSAHVKKSLKKLKGTLLIYDDFTVAEAKFTLKPSTFSPVDPRPDSVSGFQDGLPSIAGTWSGKHRWKGYAMYVPEPGEKSKGKGKDPIRLAIGQDGSSITVDYTVSGDEGEEIIPLTGKHGNGHFFARGTHPTGGPMFLIGHVKKRKIKGRAITTFDSAVFEARFKVKLPR